MNLVCPTVHAVLGHVIRTKPTLIGIDGLDGCGKTTLAHELAGHTGHQVVSIDAFLDKNKGTYIDHVDYSHLRNTALQGDSIIEGVCLMDVVARAGLSLDLTIYVEHRQHGVWEGQDCLGLDQNVADFLRKLGKEPGDIDDLYGELVQYHHAMRPHERTDLTYHWKND